MKLIRDTENLNHESKISQEIWHKYLDIKYVNLNPIYKSSGYILFQGIGLKYISFRVSHNVF